MTFRRCVLVLVHGSVPKSYTRVYRGRLGAMEGEKQLERRLFLARHGTPGSSGVALECSALISRPPESHTCNTKATLTPPGH